MLHQVEYSFDSSGSSVPDVRPSSNVSILIIEDDLSFLTGLRLELASYDVPLSVFAVTSEEEGIALIKAKRPDLILIDYMLGTGPASESLYQLLRDDHVDFIIMSHHGRNTKAYREILQLRPLTFLSKPVDPVSLRYHIDQVRHRKQGLSSNEQKDEAVDSGFLFFKWKSEYIRQPISGIQYVFAEGNYVTLFTNEQKYVLRISLANIHKQSLTHQFIRVHRNYLVNRDRITRLNISKDTLTVGGVDLPIGRTYKQVLKRTFAGKALGNS